MPRLKERYSPGFLLKFVQSRICNLIFCLTLISIVKKDDIKLNRPLLLHLILAQNLFIERLTRTINLIRT
jgi:hypothetical protein